MDLHANKVWLPGAASCLLFFGLYFMFPAYTNFGRYGFLFISIPYLAVMPFVGALGAYLSRQMKGSVVERILSALFPVFTFAALFAVRIVYGLFFEREPYFAPFPARTFYDSDFHHRRWPVPDTWRMAVLTQW